MVIKRYGMWCISIRGIVQLWRGKSAQFQLLKSCHNHQFLVKDDFSFSLDYFVKCAESLLLYNPVDFKRF